MALPAPRTLPARAGDLLAETDGVAPGRVPDDWTARLPASAVCELHGEGATSLALALAAARLGEEGFAAAIGLPHLGLEAASELGIDLGRLALCPLPGRAWPQAAALALEGCRVVLLAPATACTEAVARRLGARVREQRGLLLLLHGRAAPAWSWPGSADAVLTVRRTRWSGLGDGPGRLEAREVELCLGGRRVVRTEAPLHLALPGPGGRVTTPERLRASRRGAGGPGERAVRRAG